MVLMWVIKECNYQQPETIIKSLHTTAYKTIMSDFNKGMIKKKLQAKLTKKISNGGSIKSALFTLRKFFLSYSSVLRRWLLDQIQSFCSVVENCCTWLVCSR